MVSNSIFPSHEVRSCLMLFSYFRYADVTPEGTYKTAIENDGARFNVTISALIGCRVSLSFQAIAASKVMK